MANKGLIRQTEVTVDIELWYPSFLVVFDHIHKLHKIVDKIDIIKDCSTGTRWGEVVKYRVVGINGVSSEAILAVFMPVWERVFVDKYGHLEVK